MGMMDEYLKKIGKLFALIFCASAISFASPASTQTTPSEPVPEPPPSVNDFSLTPGGDQTSPQPAPEVPADNPSTPETTSPAAGSQPDTAAPQPSVSAPTSASRLPAPAANNRPPDPAPDRPQPKPTSRSTTVNPVPQQQIPETTVDTEPAPQPEESDPVASSIPDTPLEQAVPPAEQTVADENEYRGYLLPISLILAALLASVAGLVVWRRKKNKISTEDAVLETAPVETSPVKTPAEPVEPEPAPPEEISPSPPVPPNRKTASEPVRETDGFVTSKIGKAPPARQPVPQPEPSKLDESSLLETNFTAKHASSTLMNAVVGYQIDIRNLAKGPIQNLKISGAMIQADHNVVDNAAASQGLLLEELENLSAGKSETVSGEIRLPLNSFSPIIFQSQKLMVPLVLLRFDYDDQDGIPQVQTANFLIGTEHNPPQAKMAPFRLDQGPKNYRNVSHRSFQG